MWTVIYCITTGYTSGRLWNTSAFSFLYSPHCYRLKRMVEINFLCVHKKLRSKRVAPVLIREITRRVNLEGIFQAVYTAGVVLPKPVSTCRYAMDTLVFIDMSRSHLSTPRWNFSYFLCWYTPCVSAHRYWHRSLNPRKLVEVKFSHLSRNMTLQRTMKLYRLPDVNTVTAAVTAHSHGSFVTTAVVVDNSHIIIL